MQQPNHPDPTLLADGLHYRKETSAEQPERYLTLYGNGNNDVALTKTQALALFRVILDDLAMVAGTELHDDSNLYEIDLVHRFHSSTDWLTNWSPSDLAEPELLNEAHEQYQHSYELQEEMLDLINGWQTTLEQEYSKLEDAAEELGVALDELEDGDDREEEDEEE